MSIPLGLDFESSTAQASPLYNQNAGIFFGNAGDVSAGGGEAISQKTPSRQMTPGNNALADSTLGGNFLPISGGVSIWVYVGLAVVVLVGGIFAIKKL